MLSWMLLRLACMAWMLATAPENANPPEMTPEGDAPSLEKPKEAPQPAAAQAEIQLAICQEAYMQKRFQDAQKACSQALQLVESLAAARVWLARALWAMSQKDEAMAQLEEAVRQLPPDARLLEELGLWQLEARNVVWAARNLRQALELAPADESIRLACVTAFMENAEWQEAIRLAQPLFSASPETQARAHLLAGIAALKAGDRAAARRHFRKARTKETAPHAAMHLDALTRAERGWKKGIFFHFQLGMGVDTNPAYSQELDVVRAKTLSGVLTQPMRLAWVPREDVRVEGGLSYLYFFAPWDEKTHEKAIAFSNLSADAAVAGRWFLSRWPWPAHMEGQVSWMALGLMGGEGIPGEPEPFAFMERGALQLEMAMQPATGQESGMGFTLNRTAYRDSDRDGLGGTLYWRHSWFWRQETRKLFVQASAGTHQAAWAAWSFWSASLWSGYSMLIGERSEIALTTSMEGRIYPDSAREMARFQNPWNLREGEDRKEWGAAAAGVFSRFLSEDKTWRWELTARWQILESNTSFSFRRLVVMLQLAGDISRR